MGWRRIAGRIAKVGARFKGEPETRYQKIRYYEEEAGIFNDRELIDMYKISEQTYQRMKKTAGVPAATEMNSRNAV